MTYDDPCEHPGCNEQQSMYHFKKGDWPAGGIDRSTFRCEEHGRELQRELLGLKDDLEDGGE